MIWLPVGSSDWGARLTAMTSSCWLPYSWTIQCCLVPMTHDSHCASFGVTAHENGSTERPVGHYNCLTNMHISLNNTYFGQREVSLADAFNQNNVYRFPFIFALCGYQNAHKKTPAGRLSAMIRLTNKEIPIIIIMEIPIPGKTVVFLSKRGPDLRWTVATSSVINKAFRERQHPSAPRSVNE